MNVANMAIVLALLLIYVLHLTKHEDAIEGYRSTKCFSCEAQDRAMGIIRSHGTKCFSCEAQSDLAHPNKCLSCGN